MLFTYVRSAQGGPPKDPPAAGVAAAKVPSWTSLYGVTIEGEFVRLEGEAVVIRRGGRSYTIPFGRLSSGSVSQAKRLGGRKP